MKNIFKTMLTIGIIKKVILVLVLLSTSLNAQLDRSIMPESGPAPEIFFGKPQTFNLDNGLTVMVVENTSHWSKTTQNQCHSVSTDHSLKWRWAQICVMAQNSQHAQVASLHQPKLEEY